MSDDLLNQCDEKNKRIKELEKALKDILKVYDRSPVKIYQRMEDIAKQALKNDSSSEALEGKSNAPDGGEE